MQFPRVWEDDANSNDSKKVMLHTLRDQLGRTPRGRYRSAMILTEQQVPEHIPRISSTAHHKLGPTPDDGPHAVQLKLVKPLKGHDVVDSLPIVPHLDKTVLITGHRYVRVQAGTDVQGGVVTLQIFVPKANPVQLRLQNRLSVVIIRLRLDLFRKLISSP